MLKLVPVGIIWSVFFSSDLTVLPPLAFQNPRTRMNGLPSPPPSDETAPPSSPTPSVRFDSNGVFTRYKLVRAKIRQVRIYPTSAIVPSLYCLTCSVFQFTSVAKGARRSALGYPRAGELWCRIPRSRIHTRRYRYVEWRDCFRHLAPAPVRLSLLYVYVPQRHKWIFEGLHLLLDMTSRVCITFRTADHNIYIAKTDRELLSTVTTKMGTGKRGRVWRFTRNCSVDGWMRSRKSKEEKKVGRRE